MPWSNSEGLAGWEQWVGDALNGMPELQECQRSKDRQDGRPGQRRFLPVRSSPSRMRVTAAVPRVMGCPPPFPRLAVAAAAGWAIARTIRATAALAVATATSSLSRALAVETAGPGCLSGPFHVRDIFRVEGSAAGGSAAGARACRRGCWRLSGHHARRRALRVALRCCRGGGSGVCSGVGGSDGRGERCRR